MVSALITGMDSNTNRKGRTMTIGDELELDCMKTIEDIIRTAYDMAMDVDCVIDYCQRRGFKPSVINTFLNYTLGTNVNYV